MRRSDKKKIKDHYKQKKKIKNPFKKEKVKINWKKTLVILLVILIFSALIWWIFFSGFWSIKKIEIKGLERTPQIEVEGLAWGQIENENKLLSQKNLFFLNKEELIEKMKNNFRFPEVNIKRSIPDKITIRIKESKAEFILIEGEKKYKIDEGKYVIEETEHLNKNLPIIRNSSTENKIIGDRVYIDNSYTDYIIDLYRIIEKDFENIEIEKFILDHEVPDMERVKQNTITMKIANGPIIYLNMEVEAQEQMNKLFILKNKELKERFMDSEYIDLRYGDRIFYK